MKTRFRKGLFRTCLWVAGTVAIMGLGLVVEDRLARPSLIDFDPDQMGRLESAMWRSYYEHRWFALATRGLEVSCGEYGFSIWDGIRTSLLAAEAARHFRGDTSDPRCLPLLRDYYELISDSLGRDFDTEAAAGLELQWWRERRRKLAPEIYGRTVAENVAAVYGLPLEVVLPGAMARARAMDYRDRLGREGQMRDEDWDEVTRQLTEAYALLKKSASANDP